MAKNLTAAEKDLIATHAARFWNSPGMIEHVVKTTSAIVTVRDYIVTLRKPSIHKNFYFAERGHDFTEVSEHASSMSRNEMFFLMENLAKSPTGQLIESVKAARDDSDPAYMVVRPSYPGQPDDCALGELVYHAPELDCGNFEANHPDALTDEELDRIEEVALADQEKFEKRLITYLKRYGLSKCTFSTFWADA